FNAEEICNFPCFILEDFFDTFKTSFMISIPKKTLCLNSQNVLTPYPLCLSHSTHFNYIDELYEPLKGLKCLEFFFPHDNINKGKFSREIIKKS
ncbi:MAG: hypothetical protein V1770_00130, partial [bacterium]